MILGGGFVGRERERNGSFFRYAVGVDGVQRSVLGETPFPLEKRSENSPTATNLRSLILLGFFDYLNGRLEQCYTE